MSVGPALKYVSIEDYLTMEKDAQEKHEYYAGEVYAMAGASIPHNRIVRNTLSSIDVYLREKNGEVFPSDLKINVRTKSAFVYPDLSIVCDGLQFYEASDDIITNPSVVIEVLSPHTERYDRGKKFMLCRQLQSFKEYFLISSMEMRVEKFTRTSLDTWTIKEYPEPEGAVVESTNQQILLAELYRNVVFEKSEGEATIE